MIKSKPDTKPFQKEKTNVLVFNKAWMSTVFGGQVLNPLGERGQRRTKTNPLREVIDGTEQSTKNAVARVQNSTKAMQVNWSKGGGYYILHRVREHRNDSRFLMDIYILVESIDDLSIQAKIEEANEDYKILHWHKMSKQERQMKHDMIKKKDPLVFEDIQEELNGVGRIIHYKCEGKDVHNPLHCTLDKMVEGQFKNGVKDGYTRQISAVDGSCAAGFHKEDIPHGKMIHYLANGEVKGDQGFYKGQTLDSKMIISNFNEGITKK